MYTVCDTETLYDIRRRILVQGRFVLISNTRHKLEAAKYHLQRMRDSQSDPNPHIFEYDSSFA